MPWFAQLVMACSQLHLQERSPVTSSYAEHRSDGALLVALQTSGGRLRGLSAGRGTARLERLSRLIARALDAVSRLLRDRDRALSGHHHRPAGEIKPIAKRMQPAAG